MSVLQRCPSYKVSVKRESDRIYGFNSKLSKSERGGYANSKWILGNFFVAVLI